MFVVMEFEMLLDHTQKLAMMEMLYQMMVVQITAL